MGHGTHVAGTVSRARRAQCPARCLLCRGPKPGPWTHSSPPAFGLQVAGMKNSFGVVGVVSSRANVHMYNIFGR
jgi:hypothetical protein